ncbi:MAG: NblA/ycf18 family protein [Cyanobacteria bacterium P01_H01_bin.15]
MMNVPMDLSLEQKFSLKRYESEVSNLSADESKDFLMQVLKQLMIKDNIIKNLIKETGVI